MRVVITGAGSGLGRALAQHYAKRGAEVACTDIALERANETVSVLPGSGHFAAHVDVGDDGSVDALRDIVHARWEQVDLLFNNAGVASGGAMLDADMAEWRWMLEINVLGVVRGCRAFLPRMVERRAGHIVNTASFAGLAAAPGIMTYGTAKAAVVALSEQLRAEVHAHGVAVSVACPSFFKTNLIENFKGNDTVRRSATRMMEAAVVTADDIAAAIASGVARRQCIIVPTPAERLRWRLKRWFPEYYFRQLLKLVKSRAF
ncbi:MAG TPA: SDR family NAD(P)-dependent oxidoreductase [Candidatus Saccharimonadia bacterium]|nr:SDR family NAD(P)-dependent oxidoreductase [Candidatus Saccharimonadia bacterium]